MSRPWPNARSSTLLSPSPPSPSLFLHNFCFSPLEFSPTCPSRSGIYARNVSFESNLIESLVSLLESVSYFFLKERTKNTFHYYLRNTCQSNHHFSFLKRKKNIRIYLYTPSKFLRFEDRKNRKKPSNRSKDVRRADSPDCYAWMEQKSRFALRSRRTR